MNPPAGSRAQVEVGAESGTDHGWSYEVEIRRGSELSRHVVTLSWVDHDYWSGGVLPPSEIVRRVVVHLLAQPAAAGPLPQRFDAATARRWLPGLDRLVRQAE